MGRLKKERHVGKKELALAAAALSFLFSAVGLLIRKDSPCESDVRYLGNGISVCRGADGIYVQGRDTEPHLLPPSKVCKPEQVYFQSATVVQFWEREPGLIRTTPFDLTSGRSGTPHTSVSQSSKPTC